MRRSRSPVLDHSIVDIYQVPGIQEYRSQFFHRRRQIRFDRLSLLWIVCTEKLVVYH